jgi:hypothetical protein
MAGHLDNPAAVSVSEAVCFRASPNAPLIVTRQRTHARHNASIATGIR